MDQQSKWLKEYKTVEEVHEAIGIEQFLNSLPVEKRVWVSERKAKTCIQAGELADEYEQVRRQVTNGVVMEQNKEGAEKSQGGRPQCYSCGQMGHLARECRKDHGKAAGGVQTREQVRCFNCQEKGHVAVRCPHNALFCEEQDGGQSVQEETLHG